MKPKNIDTAKTMLLDSMIAELPYEPIKISYANALKTGHTIYVCNVGRGCYYATSKVIILPTWIFKHSDSEHWIYYLAHELCHRYSLKHDKLFNEYMLKVCPANLQHYELDYKPRAAKAVGMGLLELL